jgi:hypothetical protein
MKKIIFILGAFLVLVSCSKQKLADMNTNTKAATNVPGALLFTYAEEHLADQDASINVNYSNFDLWNQYLQETTYVQESQYNVFYRSVPFDAWDTYYTSVLNNLKRADSLIKGEKTATATEKANLANRRAIIDLVACYAWDQMEIMWGNIPYSEALNGNNVFPKYDDAYTIHKSLISRVSTDVKALDASAGSFGAADLIYGGDVSMWKEFGNGLLVKMAIQISGYSSASSLVKTTITGAMSGVFGSSADNAMFQYLTDAPYRSPLYTELVVSGRTDYVAGKTIIDNMMNLNDPRLPLYFDQNLGADTYAGGTIGKGSDYGSFSHINSTIANDPAYPHPLMTYSEIQFYLAEAAARGIITNSAKTYYDNAVTANIVFWGGTSAQATTYLAQPSVAYNAANWKDLIGTQAWISFYLRGQLGWTEWRRLGAPTFAEPEGKYSKVTTFPFRMPYPIVEAKLNGDNWKAASSAIGGDNMNTKLYWNK